MDNSVAVKILLLMSLVNVFILTANVLTLAMPTTETGSATGNDTKIICTTRCSVKHKLCAKWCPKAETNLPSIEPGNETFRGFSMINAPDMCGEGESMSRGRCRKIVS